MFEIRIDRLPGGDATRRSTVLRVLVRNSAEGVGPVRLYDVEVAEADNAATREIRRSVGRTHRDGDDGSIRLAHRALGLLLGDSPQYPKTS